MKHRNNHFALGYWSRLRAGRSVPDQADIDPKVLKRLLTTVFVVEARSDGGFHYRLAGTALCARYGGELKGRNYLEPWDADSRVRLKPLLRQALSARLPLCVTSLAATAQCGTAEIETVLMPIAHGSNRAERFLAVAQALTDITHFAGEPIQFERLIHAELVRDEETLALPPPPAASGPSRGDRMHPRAPHLRLVISRNRAADPFAFEGPERWRWLAGLRGRLGVSDL